MAGTSQPMIHPREKAKEPRKLPGSSNSRTLEHVFRAKLQGTRVEGRAGAPEAALLDLVVPVVAWQLEVGVVEQVEGLGAELEVHPLGDVQVLHQGEVSRPVGRANEGVPSQVAGIGGQPRGLGSVKTEPGLPNTHSVV